ncbi:MAG: GAF domain-containing protein [Candidatus Binataceae bacterium]
MANFEIPFVGTPCEAVLKGETAFHPDRLQQLSPDDELLAQWGVVSYTGVPLSNSAGNCVGHLAIFDDKPMADGPRGVAIMRIFAARARAEIERLEAGGRAKKRRAALTSDRCGDGRACHF